MRIAIATDAWHPQVSGVVTKVSNTIKQLERMGHEIQLITPNMFRTFPCPTYPQIRLVVNPFREAGRVLDAFDPDSIHVTTEGPIGLAVRLYCSSRGYAFTTAYTTRFPEYVRLRLPVPLNLTYSLLKWFHAKSAAVMVSTEALKAELQSRGFSNLVIWPPGVDTNVFCPRQKSLLSDTRPLFINVGRVAVEKNIEAFLRLDLPGTKYIVGDGPDLEKLEQKYPSARFVGAKFGAELAGYYAAADVFVFPSKTDTFGLVMLEALACGTPIAAYPARGPIDVVEHGVTGYLSEELNEAVMKALRIDPLICREHALTWSWEESARHFVSNLASARGK